MTISRQQAIDLLHLKMQNQNLRRHCLAVEAAMVALANYFNSQEKNNYDANLWGIVGLLHDGDYEQTKEDMANHSVLMGQWVKDLGESDAELLDGIRSHGASHRGEAPKNPMQWALFCCDELTGLIVATALVQPDKKLASVTVDKVLSKFKVKAFAAGAKREDIIKCEDKLSLPLPQFTKVVLSGMQTIASDLGL